MRHDLQTLIDHIESSISDNEYELIKLGEEKESVGLNEYTVKILENIVDELEDIEYSYSYKLDDIFGWESEIMVKQEFNRHVGGVIESYFERS